MARTAKQGEAARPQTSENQKNGEQVQVLSSAPLPDEAKLPVQRENDVVGRAVDASGANIDPAPQITRRVEKKVYEVIRGGRILASGGRTRLNEGKIIDSLNYDIQKLRQQGIKLEEIQEGDPRLGG